MNGTGTPVISLLGMTRRDFDVFLDGYASGYTAGRDTEHHACDLDRRDVFAAGWIACDGEIAKLQRHAVGVVQAHGADMMKKYGHRKHVTRAERMARMEANAARISEELAADTTQWVTP